MLAKIILLGKVPTMRSCVSDSSGYPFLWACQPIRKIIADSAVSLFFAWALALGKIGRYAQIVMNQDILTFNLRSKSEIEKFCPQKSFGISFAIRLNTKSSFFS